MRDNSKGILLSVSASLISPVFFISYQIGIEHSSPQAYLALVFLLAVLFNHVPLMWEFGNTGVKKAFTFNRTSLFLGGIFGIGSVVGNYLFSQSLLEVGAPLTTVFIRTQVLFVIFLSWLWLDEEITSKLLIGAALCVFGFFFIQYDANVFVPAHFLSMGWGILGALNFACIQVLIKKYVRVANLLLINHFRLIVGFLFLLLLPGTVTEISGFIQKIWLIALITALSGPLIARSLQLQSLI